MSKRDFIWHSKQAQKYSKLHKIFGTPTVILSAFAGTTAFAGIFSNQVLISVLTSMISVLVAVLSAFLSFAGFEKKCERHNNFAKRCRAFEIELLYRKSFIPKSNEDAERIFINFKRLFNDIPPAMPISITKWTEKEVIHYECCDNSEFCCNYGCYDGSMCPQYETIIKEKVVKEKVLEETSVNVDSLGEAGITKWMAI